ncbi:MAG: tetratricopeptide repeat protein [Acidobacteriota bacterium]
MRLAKVFVILLIASVATAQTRGDAKQDAARAFEEGQNAHQRGDLALAVQFYSSAIEADPTLFQVYYQRAVALAQLNRESEAEADFKKAIEINPAFARAHRGLGRLLLDRGMTEEARRALGRALELDSKLKETRIYLASALLKLGETERAASVLKEAISHGESDSLTIALMGVAAERLGKTDEAFSHYSRSIEMESANATAREGRARILEARGDAAGAIEDLIVAWQSQPSSEIALHLARLYARAGRAQAAIQIYRNLIRERPEDLNLRAEMIRLMAASDQAEEAIREIERLVAAQPANARLLALAGELCEDKPERAADFYSRAVKADPADNRSRIGWGAALVRSQQYEAALPVLAEAVEREPKNHSAHANLATAFFKLRQYEQAAREFIWLIQSKPDVAASYYFLAISFDKLGDCVQAMRAYREFARRADPNQNKNEVEETNIRLGLLERLMKEGKCKSLVKEKAK